MTACLVLAGYASVFGVYDAHGDIIMPGAFSASVASYRAGALRLPLLWQHQASHRLGWVVGLQEDGYGLYMRAALSEEGKATLRHQGWVAAQAVALSIGYGICRAAWSRAHQARVLWKLRVHEISVVDEPANPAASGGIERREKCQ